jgi:hypothetical protein
MRVLGFAQSSLLQNRVRFVSVSTKIVHACADTAANHNNPNAKCRFIPIPSLHANPPAGSKVASASTWMARSAEKRESGGIDPTLFGEAAGPFRGGHLTGFVPTRVFDPIEEFSQARSSVLRRAALQ